MLCAEDPTIVYMAVDPPVSNPSPSRIASWTRLTKLFLLKTG